MSKTVQIIISGKPLAKKRPRFARRGKFVTTYNEQQTEEGRFIWEVRQQHDGTLLKGALFMSLLFVFPRPKSHYGTGKNACILKKSAPQHHITKPDNDNLQKFVKDCLNGEVYRDDSQIVYVSARKKYVSGSTINPKTQILIREI